MHREFNVIQVYRIMGGFNVLSPPEINYDVESMILSRGFADLLHYLIGRR